MKKCKMKEQPMVTSIKKNTMTKKKLINSISQDKGIHPNDVRHVIQAFLDKITDCLSRGERLEFREFGVFEVVERKQKIGRNPKNAAVPIVIPARLAVKFTPGKKMATSCRDRATPIANNGVEVGV
jgi:integration host factor subunit beta